MYIQNTNSHIRIEFCDKCNVDKNKNRQELNLWLWIVNSFFNFIYFLLLFFFGEVITILILLRDGCYYYN